MQFSCTYEIRDTRVKFKGLIKNEISSNRCTGKNNVGVWAKRSREGQRILHTYKRLGMGCFPKKVKSSLKYVFALKPTCEEGPVLLSDCLYNQ